MKRDKQYKALSVEEVKEQAEKDYPIYLERDLKEIEKLKGLEVKNIERLWWDENPRFVIKIDNNTTKEQIELFIESLPLNFQITFFDFFHPQLSDPGAYVSAQAFEDKYLYMLGNHGWSSKWKEINKKELVSYLYKNRSHNDDQFVIYRTKELAKKEKDYKIKLLTTI